MAQQELGLLSRELIDMASPPPADVPDDGKSLPWRIKTWTPEEFYSHSNGENLSEIQLAHLAYYHVIAPSSHNTVPQRFGLDPSANTITIYADRGSILPESDKDGRQATIGLGCGLANMISAASVYGLKSNVEVLEHNPEKLKPFAENQDKYTPFLKVTFTRDKIERADANLFELMKKRKMVRAISNPLESLEPQLIEDLTTAILRKYPSLHLNILTDKSSAIGKKTWGAIAFAQQKAMSFVINDAAFARELGEYLVPDDNPDDFRMRPGEFGLSYESGVDLHKGLKGEIPLSAIHRQGFPNTERQIVESASAIVIIQAKDDTPVQRLLAGQAAEDLALILTGNDWNVSMHAATTEVEIGNKPLRMALMLKNRKDYGRPMVLFAVGRPLKPEDSQRNHAARPVIEKLIYKNTA